MNSKKRKIDKVDSSQHVTRKPAQGRTGSVVDLTTTSETEDDDSNDVEFVGISSDKPAMSKATTTISNSINSVLRDSASTAPKSSNALPPLHLHTQSQLDKHGLPCSLIPDILPVELAERLYRAMLRESTTWERNTWWLADRQVTSPHTTCFYSRNDDGDKQHDEAHWYMGRKATYGRSNAVEGAATEDSEGPRPFLSEMREAAAIIQRRVNDVLSSYTRYGMEYDGPWRANVAAANCYRGAAETVGAHADQLTYLGPFPTIASLSLGTPRNFRLRAVPSVQDDPNVPSTIRTYDIHLPHNSLCIMHAGCQERYKHSIPPQRSLDLFKLKNRETGQAETFNERINITFRFYRPDFAPGTTPVCACGIPTILRADAKGKASAAIQQGGNLSNERTPGRRTQDRRANDSNSRMRFFWQCAAGAQNQGKRCHFFRILDMQGEARGPCLGEE